MHACTLVHSIKQIIVNQNLFLDKVCRVNFNLSASVCDVKQQNQSNHSRNDQILMDKVQSYVSVLNIYASLINNVLPIFVVLFLGNNRFKILL